MLPWYCPVSVVCECSETALFLNYRLLNSLIGHEGLNLRLFCFLESKLSFFF